MPSPNIIRIDANARAALAELGKLAAANSDVGEAVDDVVSVSRLAVAEDRRIARERDRLLRSTETAQQRLTRRIDEFARATKGQELTEQQVAGVRKRLLADYERDLNRQQRELGETTDALEETEDAAEGAFGLARIEGWVGAILGGGGAIAALEQLQSKAREIANEFDDLAAPTGELAQLAGGDPLLRLRLEAATDATFAEGNVENRVAANDLIRQLQSGDLLEDRAFFSQSAVIADASALAGATGVLISAFRGSGEDVGRPQDIFSKALAAATPAPNVNAEQVLQAVADTAAAATPFGLSDEELFAGISLISQRTGNASQASTQLRALLSALSRRGLADQLSGQGLPAILAAVDDLTTTAQERIEFLGGDEAARGFAPLGDRQLFASRLQEVIQAQANDLAIATIENAFDSPRISTAVANRAAAAVAKLEADQRSENIRLANAEAEAFTELLRRTAQDATGSEFVGDAAGLLGRAGFPIFRLVPGVDERLANNQRRIVQSDLEDRLLDRELIERRLNQSVEDQARPVVPQVIRAEPPTPDAEAKADERHREQVGLQRETNQLLRDAANRPALIPSR